MQIPMPLPRGLTIALRAPLRRRLALLARYLRTLTRNSSFFIRRVPSMQRHLCANHR